MARKIIKVIKTLLGSNINYFVYKIPYRRAPRLAYRLPLGRVRRASKGILHTINYIAFKNAQILVCKISLLARALGEARARQLGILYTTCMQYIIARAKFSIKKSIFLYTFKEIQNKIFQEMKPNKTKSCIDKF